MPDICSIISTPLFSGLWKICIVSTHIWEKNEGMPYLELFFVKIWWNVQCGLPFLALYSVSSQRTVLSIPIPQPSTSNPPLQLLWCQWNFLKCKCHLNIKRKHRPWAYILGFIELPYFGSKQFSADIFGWTYLYLYLNRCICICIWIKLEQNISICICIWKIQIFVFVFVFDKTYLTPALSIR